MAKFCRKETVFTCNIFPVYCCSCYFFFVFLLLIDTDTNILKTAKEKYTNVYQSSWLVKKGQLDKNEKSENLGT